MTSAAYNNLNQVTSVSGTGLLMISGSLSQSGTGPSEPGAVTVAGNVVSTDSNGVFTIYAPVVAGSNAISITAASTGTTNNVTTKTLGVNVTSGTPIPSLKYDLNGSGTNDGTFTYEWDAANRLTAINEPGGLRSEFKYDGMGRRVCITEKSSGTVTSVKNLIWDGMTIREERNASNAVTKMYFANAVQISGSNYYYTRDHLGSVRELTTGTSATVLARYDYDPYGVQTQLSGTMTADFGFTGLYYHQPTGLILAPYREYSSNLDRWLSRDPLGEDGGINLYGYVGNNPVYWVDPTGLFWAQIGAGIGGVVGGGGAFIGSLFGDAGTFGGNILATPAEVGAGITGGALIGGGLGALLDGLGGNEGKSQATAGSQCKVDSNFPPGFWPGPAGAAAWGRQNGVGADEGQNIFHDIKKGDNMSSAPDAYGVNPDTGDVIDPEGEIIGNLGD